MPDSHALSLLPVLERYANAKDVMIFFTGESGCPPLLGIQSMRGKESINKYNCQKLNERIFEFVKINHLDAVFLIARWSYYYGGVTRPKEINFVAADVTKPITLESTRKSFAYGFHKTIEQYQRIGVKVFLIEDNPQQMVDPKDALKKSRLTDTAINELSVSFNEHLKNQKWFSQLLTTVDRKQVKVFNFDNILCDQSHCPLAKNNKLLYSDDDHLSIAGAKLIYPEFIKQLRDG